MNRSDGLVRRAVKTRDNGAEGGAAGLNANTSDDDNDLNNSNKDQEDNIDDGDSKQTRLTLMEEVLLLGLKDKEVNSCVAFSEFYQNYCICRNYSSPGIIKTILQNLSYDQNIRR